MANECWSSKDTSKGYELICIVHVHLRKFYFYNFSRANARQNCRYGYRGFWQALAKRFLDGFVG